MTSDRPLPPAEAPVMWELWRITAVSAKTGISKTTIYSLVQQGKFPVPRKVGGSVAWLSADIITWMASLPAADMRTGGAGNGLAEHDAIAGD